MTLTQTKVSPSPLVGSGPPEAEFSAETWKPVVGFDGVYEVSDFGRARSMDREVHYNHMGTPSVRHLRGESMNLCKGSHGYFTINLNRKNTCMHEVVLTAFVGPRPCSAAVCRHLDGNKENNCLQNLKWGTVSENRYDLVTHGIMPCGVGHHWAKLSEESVREIRRIGKNVPAKELGREFMVTPCHIRRLINRKIWKHLL